MKINEFQQEKKKNYKDLTILDCELKKFHVNVVCHCVCLYCDDHSFSIIRTSNSIVFTSKGEKTKSI